MKLLPDKSIVALTYLYYHSSQPTPYTASASYRSTDNGHSWLSSERRMATGLVPCTSPAQPIKASLAPSPNRSPKPGSSLACSNSKTVSSFYPPATQLIPIPDPARIQADSCGYTFLLPLAKDRLILVHPSLRPQIHLCSRSACHEK